jgi:hypothetical protein
VLPADGSEDSGGPLLVRAGKLTRSISSPMLSPPRPGGCYPDTVLEADEACVSIATARRGFARVAEVRAHPRAPSRCAQSHAPRVRGARGAPC